MRALFDELQLQLTRVTFDTWLRGTTAQRTNGRLMVLCPHERAVDWLGTRMRTVTERTMAAVAEEPAFEVRAR